jgi:hypothetical protein
MHTYIYIYSSTTIARPWWAPVRVFEDAKCMKALVNAHNLSLGKLFVDSYRLSLMHNFLEIVVLFSFHVEICTSFFVLVIL